MHIRTLFALIPLAGLAACSGLESQTAEPVGTPGPPGSIETRSTWAPGYYAEEEGGQYYRERPPKPAE